MPPASRSKDRFAAAVSLATLVVGTGFVLLGRYTGQSQSPALLAVPVILAAGLFVALRRHRPGDDLAHTHHPYSLQVPRTAAPRVADVSEKLESRGYRLALACVDEGNRPGRAPAPGATFADTAVRFCESRAAAEVGCVVVRFRLQPDDSWIVLVEADDTGPGLYDELAQFLIAELARRMDGLMLVATGSGPDRRPAATVGEGLPEKPYGLALL